MLSAEAPTLWIFAGPNGSGKSSVYEDLLIQQQSRTVWIINPDRLTVRIRDAEGLDLEAANRASVERIMVWLQASIDAHQTVGVETVLSTDKYRPLVEKAKKVGFKVHLVYVVLDSPDRNVERVRIRVKKGGHAVPEDKIRSRYYRSLQQLPWFLEHADSASLWDNSGAEPKLIADKEGDEIRLYREDIKEVAQAVRSLDPPL